MRYRSKKQERVYRERRKLVAELLEERPWCELRVHPSVCTGRAVDVHEVKSRGRGGSILDRANCLTGCRACHTWVTEHPKLAEDMGLLTPSWSDHGADLDPDTGASGTAGQ